MFYGGPPPPEFQLHAVADEPEMQDDGPNPPYPRAGQVSVDEARVPVAVGNKANAGRQRGTGNPGGGNLSAVVGVCVVSSAATAITAGAVNPAVAFGLFIALLGGLSLSLASARGA